MKFHASIFNGLLNLETNQNHQNLKGQNPPLNLEPSLSPQWVTAHDPRCCAPPSWNKHSSGCGSKHRPSVSETYFFQGPRTWNIPHGMGPIISTMSHSKPLWSSQPPVVCWDHLHPIGRTGAARALCPNTRTTTGTLILHRS